MTTTPDATAGDRLRWIQSARVREDLYRIAAALRIPQYASLSGDALRDAIVTRPGWEAAVDAHRAAPAPATGGLGAILERAVADAVRDAVASAPAAVDRDTVAGIVAESVAPLADRLAALADVVRDLHAPRRIEVVRQDAPPADVGVQHRQFPRLLKACEMRMPNGQRVIPLLVGPPGTGKSSAAWAVSQALGLPYGETGPVMDAAEILGFRHAMGDVVRTTFREVWEHGGVWLCDEFDGSDPTQLVRINNGLASGRMAFPDAVVDRHPDCVVILAGNTAGRSASGYSGRSTQDRATLDRLYTIPWPIDPALERHLAGNDRWYHAVVAMRTAAEDRGHRDHVTPRASIMGAVALAAGERFDDVAEAVVRKGLAAESWGHVLGAGRRAWGAD